MDLKARLLDSSARSQACTWAWRAAMRSSRSRLACSEASSTTGVWSLGVAGVSLAGSGLQSLRSGE